MTSLSFKHIPHKIHEHWPLLIFCVAVALFGLYLPLPFQFSLYIIGVLVWFGFSIGKEKQVSLPLWLLIIPIIVFLGARIYPFLLGHPAPLGYDTGIYRYEFQKAFDMLPGFSLGIHPGLFLLADMLRMVGVTTDFLMREGYILANLLILLMAYLTGKEFGGKNAGILTALILAFSTLQFDAFTHILYKNTVGISILLFCLILLKRRSFLLLPAGIFLGILQPTHFLVLGIVIALLFLLSLKQKKDRRFLFAAGCVTALGALSVFIFNRDLILAALDLLQKKDPLFSGVFMGLARGIHYLSWYLPLAVAGVIVSLKGKKDLSLFFALLTVATIVVFRLFFFQRYLIEFDLLLIIFAGIGLSVLLPKILSNWKYISVFIIISALYATLGISHVLKYQPFISREELSEITSICSLSEKDALVMSTHSFYSPWLRGFSCHEVFAPGLFEKNSWDRETWDTLWNADKESKSALMEKTFGEETIFIFVGDHQNPLDFTNSKGFTKLSTRVWGWNKK